MTANYLLLTYSAKASNWITRQSFIRLQNKQYTEILDDCLVRRQWKASWHSIYRFVNIRRPKALDDSLCNKPTLTIFYANHMAQKAIEHAERDDFSEVERLFNLLSQPYISKQPELEKT